jgi:hypothetical protein
MTVNQESPPVRSQDMSDWRFPNRRYPLGIRRSLSLSVFRKQSVRVRQKGFGNSQDPDMLHSQEPDSASNVVRQCDSQTPRFAPQAPSHYERELYADGRHISCAIGRDRAHQMRKYDLWLVDTAKIILLTQQNRLAWSFLMLPLLLGVLLTLFLLVPRLHLLQVAQ